MGVLRKINETGMGAQRNQLPGIQKLSAVDYIFFSLHIQVSVNGLPAIENCLLFLCNSLQAIQNLRIHTYPNFHKQSF
jgi:Leucine-rich repeat (LRR) protein